MIGGREDKREGVNICNECGVLDRICQSDKSYELANDMFACA